MKDALTHQEVLEKSDSSPTRIYAKRAEQGTFHQNAFSKEITCEGGGIDVFMQFFTGKKKSP